MPFVTKSQINELIAEFDPVLERDIVMPVKDGRRGNPVLWSRRYFPAMQKLTGDTGAKTILKEYAANVWEVPPVMSPSSPILIHRKSWILLMQQDKKE